MKSGSDSSVLVEVFKIIFVAIALVLVFYFTYNWQHHKINLLNQQIVSLNSQITSSKNHSLQPNYSYTSLKGVSIKLYTPLSGSKVSNPIAVVGEVPGNWSFEATFPVQLIDSSGKIISQQPAQLLGDWETDQLVPFSVKIVYSTPETGTGKLVLQKDNPSGLENNSDSITIPITF